MGKFNTTTIMLLDEDIQLKMQNARILMQEDIENALLSAPDNHITIKTPCFLDWFDDDVCDGIELTENGIELSCEYGWRIISELDYEQLHTVYEVLKSEDNFKEAED
jgi:hypothetical protein